MVKSTLKFPGSYSFAISASESYIASIGRNVVLANFLEKERIFSLHPLSHPSYASFNFSETNLAVKSTSGEIVVLEIPSGEIISRYKPKRSDEGAQLFYSATDSHIVDASWSGFIRVRYSKDLSLATEYCFPNEMISSVSPSSDRSLWLFSHTTKFSGGSEPASRPYISLWKWPLSEPFKLLPTNLDILHAASLSPCSQYIVLIGYTHSLKRTEVHLLKIDGSKIKAVEISGSSSVASWSRSADHLGIITASGFSIFQAPSLNPVSHIDAEYPSDIAIINNGASLALGTWNSGTIVPLMPNKSFKADAVPARP